MSEGAKVPQEVVESAKKSSLPHKLENAMNVTLSRNYDSSVNPADYEEYVERIGNRSEQARALAELIAQRVPPSSLEGQQSTMLDIAAGTGIISRALADKGYVVTATDLSQNALDYLHGKSPSIATKQADMNEGLPFGDNSYDAATSVWGNRYIRDTDKFLQEVHRILKPGGVFVWPIFPSERPFWKMKNGLRQHTTSKNLMRDALTVGFSEAEVIKMSPLEALRQKIPLHSMPRYVVARK